MGFLNIRFTCFLAFATISLSAQETNDYEYERSSMHIMMLRHLNSTYSDDVEWVFKHTPFPEQFNNHNLGVRIIALSGDSEDQSSNILAFTEQVNLGKKMVAKWFNREKTTGSFNMDLVRERGLYNASITEVNIARASLRGMKLLEDAGELLIKNTYLLVNDIKYETKGTTWGISISNKVAGFNVTVTSYLYRLNWNDSLANVFYSKYYTENGIEEQEKVKAFNKDNNLFYVEYVGKTETQSSERHFTKSKDPGLLLKKVCIQAIDQNIAKLQHNCPDFRIKAPLISTNPLKAYVGMKEDIKPDSRFEVLERVIDIDGRLSYKRVGVVKPQVGRPIWDNRYMADDEDANAKLGFTEFEKVSGGDFFPGMLIREIESN